MSINITASAMAKLRWRGVSKAERSQIAKKAALAKWAKYRAGKAKTK